MEGQAAGTRIPDALKAIIEEVPGRGRFALPGALCAPVLGEAEADGPGQSLLLAMCWISADRLKSGEPARFRVPLYDLRHASGFTAARANVPVRAASERIAAARCVFGDGDPSEVAVFADIRTGFDGDVAVLEWLFAPEFSDLFVSPGRFAVLDIRHLVALRRGVDLFLYRYCMLVRRMRHPEFRVPVADLRRAMSVPEGPTSRRVLDKLARAVGRVERTAGLEILTENIRERGSRRVGHVRFRVSGGGS